MKKLLTTMLISAGLGFGAAAFGAEHEEENIDASSVPAVVQSAAEKETAGGKIVRWEKEGKNYEAVIEKDGKQWGVEVNAKGKVLSKHDEAKEHKEKGEKGQD